jgi:hypothetical protein
MELENENKILKEKYEHDMKSMREEMNQQFNQIMSSASPMPKYSAIPTSTMVFHQKRYSNNCSF